MHKHWNSTITEMKGVKLKCHMDTKLTWQAYAIISVNTEILAKGKYPNGKALTKIDLERIHEENINCNHILIVTGLLKTQLQLF